jgi:hypothetical protein
MKPPPDVFELLGGNEAAGLPGCDLRPEPEQALIDRAFGLLTQNVEHLAAEALEAGVPAEDVAAACLTVAIRCGRIDRSPNRGHTPSNRPTPLR